MKVGFAQFSPVFGEIDVNLHRVEELLDSIDTDVIVLPELFATGYLFPDRRCAAKLAEEVGKGPIYAAMQRMAKKLDAVIMGGFPEKHGSTLFNSAYAVEPSGRFHLYRKLHLFCREKDIFEPGNMKLEPFQFRGAVFGMLICFDWIFPESYRALALKGAQIILHCSNLVLPYCQNASFARAVENRMFIIAANRIGEEKITDEKGEKIHLCFTGGSIIYSPRGDVLARASEKENSVTVVEIDPETASNKWVTDRNHILRDRRPEFYP